MTQWDTMMTMDHPSTLFQFTEGEKTRILAHVLQCEQMHKEHCDADGHLTVCQLFENDTLYAFVAADMPEDLKCIDWSWLGRKFS